MVSHLLHAFSIRETSQRGVTDEITQPISPKKRSPARWEFVLPALKTNFEAGGSFLCTAWRLDRHKLVPRCVPINHSLCRELIKKQLITNESILFSLSNCPPGSAEQQITRFLFLSTSRNGLNGTVSVYPLEGSKAGMMPTPASADSPTAYTILDVDQNAYLFVGGIFGTVKVFVKSFIALVVSFYFFIDLIFLLC